MDLSLGKDLKQYMDMQGSLTQIEKAKIPETYAQVDQDQIDKSGHQLEEVIPPMGKNREPSGR